MGLYLGKLPQSSSDGHEFCDDVTHVIREASFCAVVTGRDASKDGVDGGVGGESAVEDVELTLEALRDVVATTSRLDHRRQELKTKPHILTTNSTKKKLLSFTKIYSH